MTSAFRLSPESQKEVVKFADDSIVDSKEAIKKNLVRFGAMAAVTAGILLAAPLTMPVIIGAVVTGAIGLICGDNALNHYINTREMERTKRDAGEVGFADKIKSRAEHYSKLHRRMDNTALAGVGLFASMAFAALAFPAAAPVLGVLKFIGSGAWLGGQMARDALKESRESTRMLDFTVSRRAPKDGLVAILTPSNENAAGTGLSRVPSPGADFDRAAQNPACAQNVSGFPYIAEKAA